MTGLRSSLLCLVLVAGSEAGSAQTVTIDASPEGRQQVIDGFGAHQGTNDVNAAWWHDLYYGDLGSSIYRVDLTPRFVSPYSNLSYYSPWFMGSGTSSVFNLEDPSNPDGPEGNRVRTYSGPGDYSRTFGGMNAPIAIMGPEIDTNVGYFSYSSNGAIQAGLARKEQLGDFKLTGSIWSPAPWVKVSSGNTYPENWWPGPVQGSPWPFIWGGNFAGGRLDVSGTALDVFDDAALGGTGPTSSLTQFARSTAAYIRGFQAAHDVRFYAISIQNELNFEQFYNSMTYPLSSQYIAALKAVRAEFDKYEDLRDIKIMGPEDLLGGDAYGLWQYGGGDNTIHKNLQYLRNVALDADADDALDFFAIHGYAPDGVSSAGAEPIQWDWWANGWAASPAPGIPANVQGFTGFGKKSWMTETSGERSEWLFPKDGFPSNGGWSIALKIHQALTSGGQSAWIYWTFTESGGDGEVTAFALTNQSEGPSAPKYVAAKHFFRYIRPGAHRFTTTVAGSDHLEASAYVHERDGTLTLVLINTAPDAQTAIIQVPGTMNSGLSFETYTSSELNYWQASTVQTQNGQAGVTVPGYGVLTLYAMNFVSTTTQTGTAEVPGQVRVHQNYPNPFNAATTIHYELAEAGRARLTVYDLTGRMVAVLVDGVRGPGTHHVRFDAGTLPGGVYIYELKAGAFRDYNKLVVIE